LTLLKPHASRFRRPNRLRVPAVRRDHGDQIRKLVIVSAAQASDPQALQAAQLLAQAWPSSASTLRSRACRVHRLADSSGHAPTKGYNMWRMVGRPERSDPDEFASNLSIRRPRHRLYFFGYDIQST